MPLRRSRLLRNNQRRASLSGLVQGLLGVPKSAMQGYLQRPDMMYSPSWEGLSSYQSRVPRQAFGTTFPNERHPVLQCNTARRLPNAVLINGQVSVVANRFRIVVRSFKYARL